MRRIQRGSQKRASEKRKGTVCCIDANRIESLSALFSGTFANGAVECEVLTEQRSETNLISMDMWKTLKEVFLKTKNADFGRTS